MEKISTPYNRHISIPTKIMQNNGSNLLFEITKAINKSGSNQKLPCEVSYKVLLSRLIKKLVCKIETMPVL